MVHTNNNVSYYINPAHLSFVEDTGYGANLIQVSASSSCYIRVFIRGVIGYDADGNYRMWKLTAYNNKFPDNDKFYIYARLERSGAAALVVYSKVLYNTDGSSQDGSTAASTEYYYVLIGEVSATDGSSIREISYDTGRLESDQTRDEGSEVSEMWELDKYSTPWLVRAKQWLDSFTVKGFITLIGGFAFSKGRSGDEKVISDIKRSTDSDTAVPVNDESVPTTGYVSNIIEDLEERIETGYLRKDRDDRSSGRIASDKGFEAGRFMPGATGAAVYQDEQGAWHIETDNLKVRRKFSASEVEIQTSTYVGGQQMLSAASMKVDYVFEMEDAYRCYFLKRGSDGTVIRNKWKVGDQAFCNTFNLESQADGTQANHYLWRKVTATSNDTEDDAQERTVAGETFLTSDYHFTDLSKTEFAQGSDAPASGDSIVHLGYQGDDDESRQSAIVMAGAGEGSPYIYEFVGIGREPFVLPEPESVIKPGANRLSGVLELKPGSSGWKNFEGLEEAISEAASATDILKDLEYGKNNLLRNSGFTGDYLSAVLNGSTDLKATSAMFSPSLKYWTATGAVAQESQVSESGKEVLIEAGGSMEQTLYFKTVPGDRYIFSFRGKGGKVSYSVGGHYGEFDMSEGKDFAQYSEKFTAENAGEIFRIDAQDGCILCELQLERGTVKSAWGISPLDNRSELAKYDSLSYLAAAMKGATTIDGGIINTALINMGLFNEEYEMTEVTAGINGFYNSEDSVAYWAGGNSDMANYAVAAYRDNPGHNPTKEEIARMAKFVVTHGGRAILNDIILRGYVHALGGYFKGEVHAESGVFRNVSSPDGSFEIDKSGAAAFNNGRIGAFVINGLNKYLGIQKDNEDIGLGSSMALTGECVVFQNEDRQCVIGHSAGASEAGRPPMGVLKLHEEYEEYLGIKNRCLVFDIQGSESGNYAFTGKGSGVLSGLNVGYGITHIEGSAYTLKIITSLADGNRFSVNGADIGLPTADNVRSALDIESGDFCIPVHIVNIGTSAIKVYGKNSVHSSMNNDSYPSITSFEIAQGSMATVYLVYAGGIYRAIKN